MSVSKPSKNAAGSGVERPGRDLCAYLFDLDGVVTDTAAVHAAAWKKLFDEFLSSRGGAAEQLRPFRLHEDYARHADGKPRYEGVRSFLESRGIDLPSGSSDDPPDARTVCGLGNRKNRYFREALDEHGVEVFEESVALIRKLRAGGVKTVCVSSSKNCRPVLVRAGIVDLFDAVVDGLDLERHGLPGKPRPDSFLHAARLVGVEPRQAAVVEDAVAGVAAGRAGGFELVLGIDRGAGRQALLDGGADIVVEDLAEYARSPDREATPR